MRASKDWIKLIAKGYAMGCADLVPGVSGGTVAFISGIYEELVSTIAGLGPSMIKDLFSEGIIATWKKYNLGFLIALVFGIVSAVVTLAGLIHGLQETHPFQLRSFFFGLVVASTPLILKPVNAPAVQTIALIIIGAIASALITSQPPALQSDAPIFLAISGAIAICAMILPGISGSFLLLILGAYFSVITALKNLDLIRIAAFAGGVAIGLLLFSRILKLLIKKYKDATLSILAGVMLGALGVLWPWKNNIEVLFTHSDGRKEWLTKNYLPELSFEIIEIFSWSIVGAVILIILERIANKH